MPNLAGGMTREECGALRYPRTRWFSALNEPPVRPGWYEVKCRHRVFGSELLFWDGDHWSENKLWGRNKGWIAPGATFFGLDCDYWRGYTKGD